MSTIVNLKNVRISYPHLFKKQAFEGGGDAKYSAQFIIAKGSENDKAIRDAIKTEAAEVFGKAAAGKMELWKNNAMKCFYINGDLLGREELEDAMRLTAKSSTRPVVIDADKTILVEDDGKPYAGCYVNARIDVYCQKGDREGIRCSLMGVQFAKHGQAFSGGRAASVDDFDDVSEGADAEAFI